MKAWSCRRPFFPLAVVCYSKPYDLAPFMLVFGQVDTLIVLMTPSKTECANGIPAKFVTDIKCRFVFQDT